jgi:opacity protein-like surface antigen
MAVCSQFFLKFGVAARNAFLAAALMFVLISISAHAEKVISSGASGSNAMQPYVAINYDEKWSLSDWSISSLINTRAQVDQHIGDAFFTSEWHAETNFNSLTLFELDAAYNFERDKTDAIKHQHKVNGDVGLEHQLKDVTLKADIGVEANWFENTTQSGYPSLDRSAENNVEIETALRLTQNQNATFNPFVEVAFVARDYTINTGRDFDGYDLIFGATLSDSNLAGDIGLFFGSRVGKSVSMIDVWGPQIDIEWTVNSKTRVAFAAGAGIQQDTSGDADLFQTHSFKLEAKRDVSDDLKLTLALEGLHENRNNGTETELTPSIGFDWQFGSQFGVYGSADVTYERIEGLEASWAPQVDLGFKLAF